MDSVPEVLVVSDSANQNANCFIYDLKSGGLITSFKDGNSAKRCLTLIGQDYVISGLKNQPGVRVWVLNNNLSEMCKVPIPGFPTALAVSSCGMYCVVGMDKTIYVWEIATGFLQSSVQQHSQAITCIKFSSDGSHFVSAAKDGMVLVWQLTNLISISDDSDNPKPRFVWIHHAAEVTDVYIGNLGLFSRVVTASKDMTCRIYELQTGNHLTTIHVDFTITSITMDDPEFFLIMGSSNGNIYRLNMFNVNNSEVHYDSSNKECKFIGHSKQITCLSVSATGKYLLSGSEDCDCRIWDMMSLTCIRKIDFQGPVTNAFIALLPPGLKNGAHYYPRLKVTCFKNHFEDALMESTSAKVRTRNLTLMHIGAPDEYFDRRLLNLSESSLLSLNRNNLSEEVMTVINNQLYSYALCEGCEKLDEAELQKGEVE